MRILDTLSYETDRINSALIRTTDSALLKGLIESQNYSLIAGGKRIRPLLCILVGRLFGADFDASLPFALATELTHTASLIHDDMPEIDNDELRRGRPTNHTVFGQACALLAGDGLFIDAFSLIADNERVCESQRLHALRALARAAGSEGLVGGEYIDVMCEGKDIDLDTLRQMHARKTGALIRAAAELGALSAGLTPTDEGYLDACAFAEGIGLAFQIVDDALDKISDSRTLGKKTGADEKLKKSTYLSFYTPTEALSLAEQITERAISHISKYEGSETLAALARELAVRKK